MAVIMRKEGHANSQHVEVTNVDRQTQSATYDREERKMKCILSPHAYGFLLWEQRQYSTHFIKWMHNNHIEKDHWEKQNGTQNCWYVEWEVNKSMREQRKTAT